MPFSVVDAMDSRAELVRRVKEEGWTLAAASREAGVCWTTGRKWLDRWEAGDGLAERSRRPHSSPARIAHEMEERILQIRRERPTWGGRKIAAFMGPEAPSARTVDRVIARAGLAAPSPRRKAGRFERETPNELWQMDFLGTPRGESPVLGCIDDASRFCILLAVAKGASLDAFWPLLWEAFGQFGMPEAILTDNGAAFKNIARARISSFDLRLLRLGIRSLHGRPRHPQTQGKIERLFGTLRREKAEGRLQEFRQDYNHIRPHQALGQKPPAQTYEPSPRQRPEQMPSPLDFPPGAKERRTSPHGDFTFNGIPHRLGRALASTTIAVKDDLIYSGQACLGPLEHWKRNP